MFEADVVLFLSQPALLHVL